MQKGCSHESKTVVRDYHLLREKFGIIINRVNDNDPIKHVIIRAHHFVRNRSYFLPTYCWQISDHRAPLREPVQPKVKWGEAKVKWEFAEPLLLRRGLYSNPSLVRQFLMTECQCVNVVATDPTFVVCACHQCLRLLHCTNCILLIVDAFECAVNHSIILTLCFQYTFEQFVILHTP